MSGRITAQEARRLFDYDPDTGIMRWRIKPSGSVHIGDETGRKTTNRYQRVMYLRTNYLFHRVVWLWVTGEWPKRDIDHIDGNPLNNRLSNLRDVSKSANRLNNKSKGYYKCPTGYSVYLMENLKHRYLGAFKTEEEAKKVYEDAKSAALKRALNKA